MCSLLKNLTPWIFVEFSFMRRPRVFFWIARIADTEVNFNCFRSLLGAHRWPTTEALEVDSASPLPGIRSSKNRSHPKPPDMFEEFNHMAFWLQGILSLEMFSTKLMVFCCVSMRFLGCSVESPCFPDFSLSRVVAFTSCSAWLRQRTDQTGRRGVFGGMRKPCPCFMFSLGKANRLDVHQGF